MTVATRLTAFAVLLAVAFGGAFAAGRAIDPTDAAPGGAPHGVASQDAGHRTGTPSDEHREEPRR